MNATQVVAAINGNLQEVGIASSVSVEDNATELCETLNDAFDGLDDADELSASMSASSFVGSVNKDFGIAAEGEEDEPLDEFTFLHLSDTHGTTGGITRVVNEMDSDTDIKFALHSGDLSNKTNDNEVKTFDNNIGKKLLFCQGNHDANELCKAFDTENSNGKYGKYFLRQKAESWMNTLGVVWGNTQNDSFTFGGESKSMPRGMYWSKDFLLSDGKRKLRVICVDLYNQDKEDAAYYTKKISQTQADWFVGQLSTLGPKDYFLVTMHEPPVAENKSLLTGLRRANAFCSSRLFRVDPISTGHESFFPVIVDAYQNGESKTVSATIGGTATSVSVDFSGITSATFIGWFCGHIHCDMITHHPNYTSQPVVCVDTSKTTLGTSASPDPQSDLRYTNGTPDDASVSRGTGVLINKYTIDFDNRTILVERIGWQIAVHHIVDKSKTMDELDFHADGYEYDAVGNRIPGATYNNDGYLVRDGMTIPFVKII